MASTEKTMTNTRSIMFLDQVKCPTLPIDMGTRENVKHRENILSQMLTVWNSDKCPVFSQLNYKGESREIEGDLSSYSDICVLVEF